MSRQRITGINFYDILPPSSNHGGSIAIKGFYNALSRYFDVTLITINDELDVYYDAIQINYMEYLQRN